MLGHRAVWIQKTGDNWRRILRFQFSFFLRYEDLRVGTDLEGFGGLGEQILVLFITNDGFAKIDGAIHHKLFLFLLENTCKKRPLG